MTRAVCMLFLLVAFAAGHELALAAPRLAPLPAPPEPTAACGTYGWEQDSPVLKVPLAGGSRQTVWLVFPDEESEMVALAGLAVGDPLAVRGKGGRGGKFLYVSVSALQKPPEGP